MEGMRRALVTGAVGLALALALGLSPSGPAQAQGAASAVSKKAASKPAAAVPPAAARTPEQGMTVTELEALARTLENDAEREKFLGNLKALIAARRAEGTKSREAEAAGGLSGRIAGAVSRSVQALGERFAAVIGLMADAPRLWPWLESWLAEEAKRDRLMGLIWRFLVIVGIGMALQYLFRRASGRWREGLERDTDAEAGGLILRFIMRTLLLYANAFAYGAGAYGALVLLPMTGAAGEILLVGASSFFAAKLILATTRVLFAPGVSMLRPVPVGDQTATYIYLWVRRLVRIFVYGFFFLYAAFLAGLPETAYRSLLYVLGLALVGFLVVFVLQNRTGVAAAIRGPAGERIYGGLRARLAGIWHVFAILYIVAVYAVWLFEVEGGFEYLMIATGWTALAVVVAKLLTVAAALGVRRLFDVSADLETRFPGLEARANRYVPVLNRILAWLVYIGAGLVVLDVWGVDTLGWLASPEGAQVLRKTVTVAFILLVGLIVWEIINLAIGRYLGRLEGGEAGAARAKTLLPLMRTTALIVVSVVVSLTALSEIGFNIGPLLAGAGVIGLAVGFGSQKLVQDVITGLFMLVENTLAVGDVVRFDADHAGVVESISIRSVRLRDLSGNVHTLPFSEVKTTLNMTRDWSFYVFDVGIAYREDVDHVISVLNEIGAEMQADREFGPLIEEPLEILGLDKFADSAVVIKARIKVSPPINQWKVGREFNRRMKARFDAEGIEIPFPHQTLYFGEDKSGKAPPAHVALVDQEAARAAAETPDKPAPAPVPARRMSSAGDNVEDS